MNSEVISNLVGKLSLDIDGISKLQAFERKLQNVAKKMQQFGKQWEQLGKQMSKSLGVVDQAKQLAAKEKWIRALERELRAEKALEAQRRKTFQAELKAQQKLKASGTKAAHTSSPALAAKQAAAVQAAKQQNATQPKKRGRPASNTSQASAAQLHAQQVRQARLQAIYARTQSNTQKSQAAYQATQTKIQRLQQQMQLAAVASQQKAAMHQVRMQAQQARQNTLAQAAQQRAGRYAMAQQKHQHWLATRGSNSGSGGPFSVVGAFTGSLGIATAGLYALGKGLSYLNQRVEERQRAVVETQGFNQSFGLLSNNKVIQSKARQDYLKTSDEYAMSIDTDSARDFSNFIGSQMSMGKTYDKALGLYRQQTRFFRTAGLDRDTQKRVQLQLNQIAAKGKSDGEDMNTLFEAAGAQYAQAVGEAATKKYGANIAPEKRMAYIRDLSKKGKMTYNIYLAAMADYNDSHKDQFDKSLKSVAAQQQRLDNLKFQQANNINTDPELEKAIQERIQAERELTEALQPVKQGLMELDTGLTKLNTGIIRQLIGKNADGTSQTEEQKAQIAAAADGAMIVPFDPNADKITTPLDNLRARKADPIDRLWRSQRQEQELDQKIAQLEEFQKSGNWGLAYAVPPIAMTFGDEEHHWTLGKNGPSFTPDQIRAMSPPIVPQVSNSFLPMDARPSIPSVSLTPESIQAVVAGLIGAKPDVPASGVMAPDITVHQTINIDADVDSNSVKQKLGPMLKSEARNALEDMLGRARAQQAERR